MVCGINVKLQSHVWRNRLLFTGFLVKEPHYESFKSIGDKELVG